MNTILKNEHFVGFEHSVTEVERYIRAGEIFTFLLKDRRIIHHTIDVKDADLFENWLIEHNIINIKS